MKRRAFHRQNRAGHAAARGAFTLMELLVVLAIIGLLTAVALPSIGGMRKSNVMANAVAQLTADISNARQTAIRERTTVHLIFVPGNINSLTPSSATGLAGDRDRKSWQNLLTHPYSSYAFFIERTVGDQPGQPNFRYLGPWRTLPDGVFIAEWEFVDLAGDPTAWNQTPVIGRPFKYDLFPFPTAGGVRHRVPHITFDPTGALEVRDAVGNRVKFLDEVINLARGSIFAQRIADGSVPDFDVRESPPGNSTNDYNRIRIDGLSGRARVERPQIQ